MTLEQLTNEFSELIRTSYAVDEATGTDHSSVLYNVLYHLSHATRPRVDRSVEASLSAAKDAALPPDPLAGKRF